MSLVLLLCTAAEAFEVIAHRGSRAYRPENTIAAFEAGVDLGATTLEGDVVGTKDGRLVLTHDRRISRVLCRGPYVGRLVKTLTLEQVRRMDCGRRRADDALSRSQVPVPGSNIPTLRQVLRLVKRTRADLLLELKVAATAPRETPRRGQLVKTLRDVVRRQGMTRRVTVQSYDWRTLKVVQLFAPRLSVVALASRATAYPGSPWVRPVGLRRAPNGIGLVRSAARAGFEGLSPDKRLVTPEMVAAAHRRGLLVLPYTVDDEATMRKLIGMGVDGLISDFPERVRALARRSGLVP